MNLFFLYILTMAIFSPLNSMDCSIQVPCIWAITTDQEVIEIDEGIAQQSNLLTVLQQKYAATPQNPIPLTITKNDFNFFSSLLTIPALELLTNLSDADYSKLMDIAEKLKCPIFYAELMEQLVSAKDLIHYFAQHELNHKAIAEPVSQHFMEKKCIKKSKLNRSKPSIMHTNDGKYFTETIPTNSAENQLHLWRTQPLKCIKTFPTDYQSVKFSPSCKHMIAAPCPTGSPSIKKAIA
jgi:hypothetical protein